ncbi:MAG: NAD(P)-dependent oxidoreductase [Deltaproteobacteria bacterium]|nr:NAD(P)-dependent oxidoreductase [Deltaproteobacteria bacterium]
MAEILITGGAGNLGRMLASALRKEGHGLRILDLPSCDFSFCSGWEKTRAVAGNILDPDSLKEALAGVDWVFHLAAILPPASEADRARTFRVNVEGTRSLLEACASSEKAPKVVFASSVSVWGDTSRETDLIGPDHPVNPNDWYAESKVEAERLLFASGLPYANLRISAISIPVFLDPPEPWPFTAEQRIELVALADLVRALVRIVGRDSALGRTLLIAGGPTWQVTGARYVELWGEAMEIPLEDMRFQDRPGWLNWYDTGASQALLDFQQTTLPDFMARLRAAVEEELA